MKKSILTIVAIATLLATTACQSNKENTNSTKTEDIVTEQTIQPIAMARPRIVIYKTTADYSNFVPVAMD